MKEHQKNNRK